MPAPPEDQGSLIEAKEVDLEALANLATERASVYSVLGRLLLRPLKEDEIRKLSVQLPSVKGIIEQVEGEEASLAKMKSGLRQAKIHLEKLEKPEGQEIYRRLSAIYTRLFRGLSKERSPPPPYESVYAENGALWGNCTIDVQRLYRARGFEVAVDLGHEPPDHIALELGFMACLCRQESEALQKCERNEALRIAIMEFDFLKDHLLSWMPIMRQRTACMDELGFYSGILELTEGWIEHDAAVVKETITALTVPT